LKGAYITQTCTLAGYIFYFITRSETLSYFHTILAFHLAHTAYMGAFLACLIAQRNMRFRPQTLIFQTLISGGCFLWQVLQESGYWDCDEHPDIPGSDKSQLRWPAMPGTCGSCPPTINSQLPAEIIWSWVSMGSCALAVFTLVVRHREHRMGEQFSFTGVRRVFIVVILALIAHTIWSIEIAMLVNPVDLVEENAWGFGQVGVWIISRISLT
jgi:hypothetical protein